MRVVLGTAHVLAGYGLESGEDESRIANFLETLGEAHALGVSYLDTAPTYGDSEMLIGSFGADYQIVTKVYARSEHSIEQQIVDSLGRLQRDSLYGCLIHDWSSLEPQEAGRSLRSLVAAKEAGLATKVGVSAYSPTELTPLQESDATALIAQVPVSVLDQRFAREELVKRLAIDGVEFHARSIFLQGLILGVKPDKGPAAPEVTAFLEWCQSNGRTPIVAAIGYVRSLHWLSAAVVGARHPLELGEIVVAFQGETLADSEIRQLSGHASEDPYLIDPRTWA